MMDASQVIVVDGNDESVEEAGGLTSPSPAELGVKRASPPDDSFDYPDDEAARNKIISDAVKQEDEFLEYIMSLGCDVDKKETKKRVTKQPPLMRSTSEKSSAKVGLDHLDNLCKLMEQLGDLRQQNSKLQRRVHYLEDLKNLQDMHKHLHQETIHRRQVQEAELLQSLQRHRDFIAESPRRSKKLCRHRQSLQPSSQQRERSQSVGIDELNDLQEDYALTNKKTKRRQRRSIAEFPSSNKAKVSKWTKVKEAFRWEKASVVMLPETKSQDSGLGGISHHCCEDKGRYLRVPAGDLLSGSPSADSVISGHSLCSSGGPSMGEYTLPPITAMSSSSSSEEIDLDFNYTDILSEFGPQRSSSATDSTGRRLQVEEKRRSSLTRTPEEDEQKSRSKSLDGDDAAAADVLITRHFSTKDSEKCSTLQKSHKTPWGKVKDIIQTRKDSLKQRHHRNSHGDSIKMRPRRGASKREGPAATSSDHEDEVPVFDAVDTPPGTSPEGASPPCDSILEGMSSSAQKPRIEITRDASRRHKVSKATLGSYPEVPLTNRRLTPMLTITLPSTEELRQLSSHQSINKLSNKPPPSPQSEERLKLMPTSTHPHEDVHGAKTECRQPGLVSPTPSAGTSPPVHRRSSKWTKVKKAFLTSSSTSPSPGQRDAEASGQLSCSVPSSPNRASNFFYETDPEELSGGELAEGPCDDDDMHRVSNCDPPTIQTEIQRNYEELQQKLSQEFHKKIHEWEKMKATTTSTSPGIGRTPTNVAGGSDDSYQCPDKGFRRKMEEWERIKNKEGLNSGKRESVGVHPLDVDNLSPHFRKKLYEWQRIKKGGPRDDNHHHSRRKIVEWQLWRTGSGKQGSSGDDQDDFHRKLREWERMKSASPSDSPTRKEAGVESERNSTGARTPSPGVVRKNSTGNAKKKAPTGGGGGGGSKTVTKSTKTQKEKELHWLEKELQKIEREKQRLEREREKYLEREKRLEKMRRAVGSSPGKQEVLIQTSTGFFRFQGISEKFTRRLYEWEKARGIAPEASTFALLDPGYKPSPGDEDIADSGMLIRSKSASSVTNLSGGCPVTAMSHQPSSLSLNDVEGLEQTKLAEARASSDPQIRTDADADADGDGDVYDQEDDEPAAVIVDIEDVVEETAALLVTSPAVQSQTPVYCYAPEEVTRLIDSSGSESERDPGSAVVRRTDSVRTESSYKLIEENMSLLSKLQIKGDICRKLESELEELEEKIEHVTKSHENEIQRLRQEEKDIQEVNTARAAVHLEDSGEDSGEQAALVDALRTRIQELERRQERLRREGATLQDSFVQHSEQHAVIAQNLVGKMKQLQQVNMASIEQDQHQPATSSNNRQDEAVALVQGLSTQLLTLAEKLEMALGERNREIVSLRSELDDRRRGGGAVRLSRGLSADAGLSLSMGSLTAQDMKSSPREITGPYVPRQSSVELTQLPSLLTHKVLELKQGLNYLCAATEPLEGGATLVVNHRRPAIKHAVTQPTVTTHFEDQATVVTIAPALLMRQKKVKEISPESEKQSSMVPTNDARESFCSTLSLSDSSTNGDRDRRTTSRDKTVISKRQDSDGLVETNDKSLIINATVHGPRFVAPPPPEIERQRELVKPRRSSDSYLGFKPDKADQSAEPDEQKIVQRSMENMQNISRIPVLVVGSCEGVKKSRGQPTTESESATPVNVFVPTTRKIFSPVRRDSKGKASSVIGYVVAEEPEVQENGVVVETTAIRPTVMTTTPPWMIMRSRSQSASPALPRRKLQEGNASGSDSQNGRLFRSSPDKTEGASVYRKPHEGSLEIIKESSCKPTDNRIVVQEEQIPQVVIKTEMLKDSLSDKRAELGLNVSRPTTPLGFPPLPPSPSPGRRDLYKQIAKDTAPSIRMMIAKYNQKLTEQDGGRSPEVGGSGSASPVAWRSPVAERRVRTQMARYQEEVQRVLQQGGRGVGRIGGGEVQKSASAGVIRSPEAAANRNTAKNGNTKETIGTPSLARRGILKSSSAGTIKPVNSVPLAMPDLPEPKVVQTRAIPIEGSPIVTSSPHSDVITGRLILTAAVPASPVLSRHPEPTSPPGSPPLPRLRALRLQQAKEEFLTRGPGGRSWTSDAGPATPTPSTSASVSSEPVWVRQVTDYTSNGCQNRLSHISVGSESSCGSQVFRLLSAGEDDDGSALMKSASAGMINVDTQTYQQFTVPAGSDSLPRAIKDKSNSHKGFGISSITSKFRRVKMRKNKVKEDESKTKMNTVSTLCRQSLLVDINRRENSGGSMSDCPSSSTSKSCPSSPVLQRTSSTETAPGDEGSNHSSASWVKISAKKIFKPK